MEGEVARLSPGRVMGQYGPMRLSVLVTTERGPNSLLAEAGVRFAFTLLPSLVPAPKIFSLLARPWPAKETLDPALGRLLEAATSLEIKNLAPMSAVAGLVSEMTAEYLKSQGAIKAIVENGGDVAIFLAPDQVAKVGVRLKITEPKPALFMELRGQDQATWGVCSSGFGGRGLTLGVADMAMCVAKSAALADAAATAVANACWVDSPSIKRLPAELVRPETDIPGLMVTSRIGELNNSEVTQALSQSLGLANKLVQQDHLLGAMVALNGQLVTTNDFRQRIAQLEGLNP